MTYEDDDENLRINVQTDTGTGASFTLPELAEEPGVYADDEHVYYHVKTFHRDAFEMKKWRVPEHKYVEEGELAKSSSGVSYGDGESMTNLQMSGEFKDGELRVTGTREISRGPFEEEAFVVEVDIGEGRAKQYLLRKSSPHHVLAQLYDGEVTEYRQFSTTPDEE